MKNVALVTGGSRGIGLGIAKELAQAGFDLAINGVRTESQVTEILDRLRESGSEVLYCKGDISSAPDRQDVLRKVKERFGRLNILVNNAGIAPRERLDILEATEESFDHVLDTNLKGTYFLTQQASRWMVEQKKANPEIFSCVVTISSISATVVSLNRGEYCISKAGLSMVTQLFAARLGEFNIPVYEIRPGVVDTDMTSAAKGKYDALIAGGLLVQKRWGLPEDVGKAVLALAEQKFPYSTGQVFMVDGGLVIQRL